VAIEKSEAIVLRTWKYGDSSRIVSLYTRRFGKLRLIARGARSKKPRFGASLEPFTESLIVFYNKRERELQLLSSSDSIQGFARTRERPAHLGFACAMIESVERLTAPEQEDAALYDLLRSALGAIDAAPGAPQAERAFFRSQKRLLDHLGSRWELESCVACAGPVFGARVAIDPLEGVLCDACAPAHRGALAISAATREALLGDLEGDVSDETLAELWRLFAAYYERCGFGKGPLRSLGYVAALGRDAQAP
jgi:DNA repair protein RecO (recombination protein O)